MIDSLLIDMVIEIISVNPRQVIAEANEAGVDVTTVDSFKNASYADIQILMKEFAKKSSRVCAVSGATSGVGGITAAVTLGSLDLVLMAAQLHRLNQKCSIVTGFPLNIRENQKQSELIFLQALGFDAVTSGKTRSQVIKAAAGSAVKSGAGQYISARLIVKAVKQMGVTLSVKQAGRAVPFIGAGISGFANYRFVNKTSDTMIKMFLKAWLDRASGEE